MNILQKMFLNHQWHKKHRLQEEGLSAEEIMAILKADEEFFVKEVAR